MIFRCLPNDSHSLKFPKHVLQKANKTTLILYGVPKKIN